jgi:hypothetical protein
MNKKTPEKFNGFKNINDTKYVKPTQSISEKLSEEDIINLLLDYQEVKFENLQIGINTRYYSKNKDGKLDFKFGGILLKVNTKDGYCVFSAKGLTWSVQSSCIFYQEMSNKDKIKELQDKIQKQSFDIEELVSYAKKLQKEIDEKDKIIKDQKSLIKKLQK